MPNETKKRKGGWGVWPKDSKDKLSVQIIFSFTEIKNNADLIRAGSEAESSVVL